MRVLRLALACVLAAGEVEVADVAVASCMCDEVKVAAEREFKQQVDACMREKAEVTALGKAQLAEAQKSAAATLQKTESALAAARVELRTLVEQKTALDKKVAQLAAISDKAKEAETCRADLTNSKTQLETCNRQLSSNTATLQQELAVMKRDTATNQAALAAAESTVKELRAAVAANQAAASQLAACESERAQLGVRFDQASKDASLQHRRLQAEVAAARLSLETLEADHAKSTNVIYSSDQFWRQVSQGKAVSSAFLGFARSRVVNIIGRNNYELITLQAAVFANAASRQARAIYIPMREHVSSFYIAHIQTFVQPGLDYVAAIYQIVAEFVQNQSRKVLGIADAYMERVIDNLTTQDPSIRTLFPESFNDRCYAFAFISLILYVASELFQWLWSKFVAAPLAYMLGVSRTTKSAKKSSKSSKNKPSTGVTVTPSKSSASSTVNANNANKKKSSKA
eukprot:Gregarina_sp_Poly_1__4083@NODE_223_length_11242_cov_216_496107_g197_i0_p4_GENE_NODE_223_length_11242_cov_216_496107_g197_i0NODE_223_length_11242_cov_216_496107_g197_i0_p4_ORF_typecomplete_len458_score88_17MAD/PF05557_13/0_00064GAS/PF13851_6/43GAS/PF13851_6/0_00087ADIP/PF11559_8/2_1e03ADIP/PF11559_8/0_0035ADIP/PF11559_8/48HOOK/PF05622_12/0_0072zfC4H2/PF10146_9/0_025SPC25/PF06703_11/0_095Myosin_tail_1/PF01576_19/1_3e02Myosin_tail_1/PF01576_19/0_2CCCAP/PF15964_5/0_54AAA_13/PF13166_6/0_8Spc7/PF08317